MVIHEVLKYYSIDQNETMSFGDGKNDIDMFEYTKISVAMGNAEDDVKKLQTMSQMISMKMVYIIALKIFLK